MPIIRLLAYEKTVQKQATLTEQARLKEQAARELDNKAKSIKDKSITDEPRNYALILINNFL